MSLTLDAIFIARLRRSSCCIDKSSTAELSEAINSMFRWYRTAAICYAYLSDVSHLTDLEQSRWFTRGWTLQELLAPKDVRFYSSHWKLLGSKLQMSDRLWEKTGIEPEVLSTGVFDHVSIAMRMSWAAGRKTTRVEDAAYCLMGMFDVNMPLLYGEGKKSFLRLQEEIMKVSDDHSLFAWGLSTNPGVKEEFLESKDVPDVSLLHGLFADSPADFTLSDQIIPLDGIVGLQPGIPPMISSSGVRIELPTWKGDPFEVAAISCSVTRGEGCYLGIPLFRWSTRCSARYGELVLIDASGLTEGFTMAPRNNHSLLIKAPISIPQELPVNNSFKIVLSKWRVPQGSQEKPPEFLLENVHCLPHATFSATDGTVTLSEIRQGPHVVMFFTTKTWYKLNRFNVRNVRYFENIPKRFAVILGGEATRLDGAWATYIDVLGDATADEDFYRLFNTSGRLVANCGTRNQIISSLTDCTTDNPLLRHRKQHIQRTIKKREETYHEMMEQYDEVRRRTGNWRVNPWFMPLYDDAYGMLVTIALQTKPCSFVEMGNFVHISLSRNPPFQG